MQYGLFAVLLFAFGCAAPVWHSVDLARRQGETAKIERLLIEHLQAHPNDAKAYFMLGDVRAELGKWQGMVDAFDACEKINASWRRDIDAKKERHWRKNFNDGVARQQAGNFDESLVNFAAVTIIYPERAIGHRLFGEASLAFGDTAQALKAFETALSLDFDDHLSRRNAMSIYFSTENYTQAIEQAEILLISFPNDNEALRFRAYSLDRLDRRIEATEAYTKLIAVSTDHEDVESFAAFKYRLGLYDDAIALSELAITRGGDREQNWQAIVQSRLMQQNYPELLGAASTLAAIAPDNLLALELKQLAQITLGQVRQARQTKLDYLHALARLRLKQKLYPELLDTTDEILSIRENDLEALRLRAATLDSTGNYRKARETQLVYLDVLAKKQWEERNFLEVIRTTSQTLALDSTNFQAVQIKQSAHDSLDQPHEALQTELTYHAAVARAHLHQRNFYGFLKKALDILEIDPDNLVALKYQQMAHDSLGQFHEAEQAKIRYLLAVAEQEMAKENFAQVIARTDEILDLNRVERRAIQLKKAAHEQLGQNVLAAKAEIDFQLARIEKIASDDGDAQPFSDAQSRSVLAATDTILALDRGNITALEHRKNAWRALGQHQRAQVAEIDYLLAVAHDDLIKKDFQSLLATSDDILAIDNRHLRALDYKKTAMQRLGRADEARQLEIESLLIVADSLLAQKNYQQLLATADRVLALDRLNKQAVEYKQQAHRELGQQQLEQQAIVSYWLDLANLRMQQKNYRDAHILLDNILKIDPQHIEALTMKRNAYLSTARLDEAMALKKQIELLQGKKQE